MHYAIKEIGRRCSNPTVACLRRMKRAVRYMSGAPDIGMFFPRGNGAIDSMSAVSDSDWAKGAMDRRST
eukprot:11711471-Heterocapsa_arctica.AAC.1